MNMKQSIKSAFDRFGMQAKTEHIIEFLAAHGVSVSAKIVQKVRMQILKQRSKAANQQYREKTKATKPKRIPVPPKIPRRRHSRSTTT